MPLLAQALLYVFACIGLVVTYTYIRFRISTRRGR